MDVLDYNGLQTYDEKIKGYAQDRDSIVQYNADLSIASVSGRVDVLEQKPDDVGIPIEELEEILI